MPLSVEDERKENGTAKGRGKEKIVNVVKEERKGKLHTLKCVVNSRDTHWLSE